MHEISVILSRIGKQKLFGMYKAETFKQIHPEVNEWLLH